MDVLALFAIWHKSSDNLFIPVEDFWQTLEVNQTFINFRAYRLWSSYLTFNAEVLPCAAMIGIKRVKSFMAVTEYVLIQPKYF